MTIANPTPPELARADFIRQSNMEARLCLDAARRARRARRLVETGPGMRSGAQPLYKIHVSSSLVYRLPPLGR